MAQASKRRQFPPFYPQSRQDKLYYPRKFGEHSWVRFARHRRARYRLRIGAAPTDLQEQLIRHLLITEWSALENEDSRKMREARIARTAFRQGLLDFEKTLSKPAPPPPSMGAPKPLHEIMAEAVDSRRSL
jgi:hypothetical protein